MGLLNRINNRKPRGKSPLPCVGLDFGTMTVRACHENGKLIFEEPALLALQEPGACVVAMGNEAKKLLADKEKNKNLIACRPMLEGSMEPGSQAMELLKLCVREILKQQPNAFRLVISLHDGLSAKEEETVRKTAMGEGVANVHMIRAPLAAAIGCGALDANAEKGGQMVVSIGASSTDAGLFSCGDVLYTATEKVGGLAFNEAIVHYLRRYYQVTFSSFPTAEDLKKSVGTLYPEPGMPDAILSLIEPPSVEAGERQRAEIPIPPEAFPEMLSAPVLRILELVAKILERAPLEILGDLHRNSILLVGGGAALRGLDRMIAQAVNLPVFIPENACTCCAEGAARAYALLGEKRVDAVNFSDV